jgi:hypothetical protein
VIKICHSVNDVIEAARHRVTHDFGPLWPSDQPRVRGRTKNKVHSASAAIAKRRPPNGGRARQPGVSERDPPSIDTVRAATHDRTCDRRDLLALCGPTISDPGDSHRQKPFCHSQRAERTSKRKDAIQGHDFLYLYEPTLHHRGLNEGGE